MAFEQNWLIDISLVRDVDKLKMAVVNNRFLFWIV